MLTVAHLIRIRRASTFLGRLEPQCATPSSTCGTPSALAARSVHYQVSQNQNHGLTTSTAGTGTRATLRLTLEDVVARARVGCSLVSIVVVVFIFARRSQTFGFFLVLGVYDRSKRGVCLLMVVSRSTGRFISYFPCLVAFPKPIGVRASSRARAYHALTVTNSSSIIYSSRRPVPARKNPGAQHSAAHPGAR